MVINLYLYLNELESNKGFTNINQDLILRAKNTSILNCYFRDAQFNLLDITGWTVFFTVKNKSTDIDNDAVLKKTITSFTYPQSGEAAITLTSANTSSLIGNYIYDIKVKTVDGEFYTVLEGTICFQNSLTIRES